MENAEFLQQLTQINDQFILQLSQIVSLFIGALTGIAFSVAASMRF